MRIKTKEESQVLVVLVRGKSQVFSYCHPTLELTFWIGSWLLFENRVMLAKGKLKELLSETLEIKECKMRWLREGLKNRRQEEGRMDGT